MQTKPLHGCSEQQKKKRIGIITLTGRGLNYGNKLQNYAVEQIYLNMGYDCKTILEKKTDSVIEIILRYLLGFFCKKKIARWDISEKTKNIRRRTLAIKFNKEYLHMSKDYIKGRRICDDYDYFSIGSDQVWNPEWYYNDKKAYNAYFLTFAAPNQKICLSPSIGVNEIPDEWKGFFRDKLKTFPNISVREERGAEIVKELTGKNAEVLIDPTLMLTKDQWRKLEKKPTYISCEKFICAYFLGNVTEKQRQYIDKLSKENNLQVIELSMSASQKYWNNTNVSEFLWLISHCSIMCTNSFHGCVFSILNEKPFVVFQKEENVSNMSSRIDTLLGKFHMEDRRFENIDNPFKTDYSHVMQILDEEREKVNDFLQKSFNQGEENNEN